MSDKGVSNNSFWRDKSDKLDKAMGWEGDRKYESGARGIIHGAYHKAVGVNKYLDGNSSGGKAESDRASQQFSIGRKNIGSTPPKD